MSMKEDCFVSDSKTRRKEGRKRCSNKVRSELLKSGCKVTGLVSPSRPNWRGETHKPVSLFYREKDDTSLIIAQQIIGVECFEDLDL